MRGAAAAFALIAIGLVAEAAGATTVVIYTDPLTMTRRTVVFDTPGRDRVLMCVSPEGSCHEVPVRKSR